MKTREQCQKELFSIGMKLGVSPKLISTRLLSEDDKQDMLNGELDVETLVTAIEVWMSNNMPDYANGKTEPYKPEYELPMKRYRGRPESPPKRKFKR